MNWTIKQTVDLSRGYPAVNVYPDALMVPSDEQAHTLEVDILKDGKPVDLSDFSFDGYLIRDDGVTVFLIGTCAGNTASLTLTKECYAISGQLRAILKIRKGSETVSVVEQFFTVRETIPDKTVDPGSVIPSLTELSEKIHEYEQANINLGDKLQEINDGLARVNEAVENAHHAVNNLNDKVDQGEFDGKGLTILGYYATLDALQTAAQNPQRGDAYGVGAAAPYDIYVWDAINSQWTNNGAIQGAQGEAGRSAYQIAVDSGFAGTVSEWLTSLKGAKGEDGQHGIKGEPGKDGKDGLTTRVNGVQQVNGAITLNAGHIKMENGHTIQADLSALYPYLSVSDFSSQVTNKQYVSGNGGSYLVVQKCGFVVTVSIRTDARSWSSGDSIGVLPPACRPKSTKNFPFVMGSADYGVFRIETSGKMSVAGVSTSSSKSVFTDVSFFTLQM